VLGTSSLGPCLSSTCVFPSSVFMVGSKVASTYFLTRVVISVHFGTLRNNATRYEASVQERLMLASLSRIQG
jgi:hypothetical protein